MTLAAALSLTGTARAVTFTYEGYVAGVRAGSATVEVVIADGHYHVSGSATARGVVDWFSDWHSEFTALGQLSGQRVLASQYVYTQTDGSSRREVRVRDGQVTYLKNERPPRVSRAFATRDLLTALFVEPRCHDVWWVNTGRRNYRLERRSADAGVCRYEVFDRHEDSFEIDLVLADRFGLTVPVSLTVHALVRGRLVLVDPGPAR